MRTVDCYSCRGKGTIPVAGFLVVFDSPCVTCRGTGKVEHPQDRVQREGQPAGPIQWLTLAQMRERFPDRQAGQQSLDKRDSQRSMDRLPEQQREATPAEQPAPPTGTR